MSSQLLVNPFPYGSNITQYIQELNGSLILAGAAVATGEPINWGDLVSGIGYNEISQMSGFTNGNASALVTGLSASGGVVTVTAANNFSVGENVTFKGCTTAFGLLLNGLTFPVASVTTGTSFTIATAITQTTTSSEVGMVIVDKKVSPLVASTYSPLTATVSAISASGSILTVTAANNYLRGALVSFAGFSTGTLGAKIIAAGPLKVLNSTQTAFTAQMPSALTGSTGTGTASGVNPAQPFSVQFWSALNSGYVYQYNSTAGTLFANQVPASSALTNAAPLGGLAAAAYPAGALADVIKYCAKFPKV